MSRITKEWLLKTIAELEEERDATPSAVNEDAAMSLAAMKLALASLEARSRKLFTCSACGAEGLDEPLESKCHCNEDGAHWIESVVYTAPPAPVSVPDEMTPKQASRSYCGEVRGYRDGWNACRASMLQGAGGNSPVVQDGWMDCSERMPDGMQTVITSNGFDIGQGWWDGDEWKQWSHHDAIPGVITHWMSLPAAPQQEVK